MSQATFRDPTPGLAGNPFIRALVAIMHLGLIVGLPLLLICALIGTAAHNRIYSSANVTRPTAELTHLIHVKSRSGYVEEAYARRYELSQRLAPYFWLMAAPGFVVVAFHRRRAGNRGRRVRRRSD